jgi:UTP--glucose-1-phosphate uridylyltransferase
MLGQMLEQGYEYAFVSNSDNLGAVLDQRILGYFADRQLPFMMEVADRTLADRKGGHLAQTAGGQLLLRESAQCPDEDLEAFQNVDRHRYFNTNNLWLHLPSLQRVLEERENILGLPMIRNRKTVDPRNRESFGVYQLETAMGSAIAVFEGAGAIRVPRSRFAPVKTTNDMLAVRSDAYVLSDDYRIVMAPERDGADLVIDLDPGYYKLIDSMEARFPYGAPSLVECRMLHVRGDVLFGRNVRVKGQVRVVNSEPQQAQVESDTVLEGDFVF